MNKLLLLDSNSIMNRAFYGVAPLSTPEGLPTNAVYGYLNILIKLLKEHNPTHVIATFDLKAPTFRKAMYEEYKAQRKPMPEDLATQMPIIKELLRAMNIQIVELEGYEADDIIGTLARQCKDATIIVTGDKDSLQLLSDSTTVMLTKGVKEVIEYTPSKLAEEGLTPSQIIELKSLMGDASDNIPGVAGVGEKTAKSLLADYGNLDGVYANIDKLKGKLKERIESSKDIAYLSRELATINVNVPIEFDENQSLLQYPFPIKAKEYMQSLNFKSIIPRIDFAGGEVSVSVPQVEVESIKIENSIDFCAIMDKAKETKQLALSYGNKIVVSAEIDKEYYYELPKTLFDSHEDYELIVEKLKSILLDSDIVKYIFDIKQLRYNFDGVVINNGQDIALMAYLLKAHIVYNNAGDVLSEYGISSVFQASGLLQVAPILIEEMQKIGVFSLYKDIELPLVDVLYDMEQCGVRIDRTLMSSFSNRYMDEIYELSEKIYDAAGCKFKINSPKELGEVLFEKMGLTHGKKLKKSGAYSTAVDVLESMVNEHEIVKYIMRYREINKLLSTYINGLEPLLDKNNKLHTIFKQMQTATGRLSSTEPNLQNIPVRKPEGRELRKMFLSSIGNTLVIADYSQIELRLLAHFSQDDTLVDAFCNGKDIHTYTASLVYGVPLAEVTQEMRRSAKAVNFGIIYGISDYGLSQDIGIAPWQAKEFITKYFNTYPHVKEYLESSVDFAKKNGYISTYSGRVRFIPDIAAQNFNIRSFGERVAKNMPLQGSASDIIKIAMLKVSKALKDGGYKAKLILQIHDELIIDCPNDEVEAVKKLLKVAMESAAKLSVPLIADVGTGDSWYEAK